MGEVGYRPEHAVCCLTQVHRPLQDYARDVRCRPAHMCIRVKSLNYIDRVWVWRRACRGRWRWAGADAVCYCNYQNVWLPHWLYQHLWSTPILAERNFCHYAFYTWVCGYVRLLYDLTMSYSGGLKLCSYRRVIFDELLGIGSTKIK